MSITISGTGAITGVSTNYSFDKSVSVGGTITYEDVTNVDSVGVITARAGIEVTGGNIHVAGVGATIGVATAYINSINDLGYPSTGPFSNRNLMINGAMNVAQRGTAAVTTSGAFAVDRFKTSYNVTGGAFTAQQSTDAPEGFKNSVKYTVTTAASAGSSQVCAFFVGFEGQDVQQADLGLSTCKPLTLSFYVKSSLTGTYSATLRNPDGSRSYIAEYTINAANTWEYKTVTFPAITSGSWATDNNLGGTLAWDLGSGSDRQGTAGQWLSGTNDFASTNNVNWCNTASATWFITGVQFEIGERATPFEHRSYGDELLRCNRYYSKVGGSRVTGGGGSSTTVTLIVTTPCEMRTTPDVEDVTINSMVRYDGTGASNLGNATGAVGASFGSMYSINVSNLTGVSDNRVYFSNCSFNLAAEL